MLLNVKNIAATLAVLGSGSGLVACGGSNATRAVEVPAAQGEGPTASCASSGSCGAKHQAGCGASSKEAACGAKPAKEAACGASQGGEAGSRSEASYGAAAPDPSADGGQASAHAPVAQPAAPSASSEEEEGKKAAPAAPPRKKAGQRATPVEAACGEGTCA